MDVEKRREFGAWIKSVRRSAGMSLREVSERMGYRTRGTMAGVESGQMPLPIERIFDVAEIYGIRVGEILEKLRECEPELYGRYVGLEERFERRLFGKIRSYRKGGRREAAYHHVAFPGVYEGTKSKNNISYQTLSRARRLVKRVVDEIKSGLYEGIYSTGSCGNQ